jgi:uncharacterized membrane protein YccC
MVDARLNAGHLFLGGAMRIQKRIPRPAKNAMRARLEQVLQQYQQIDRLISQFQQETEPDEYRHFWEEVQRRNSELIQHISRYMVIACNR